MEARLMITWNIWVFLEVREYDGVCVGGFFEKTYWPQWIYDVMIELDQSRGETRKIN